MFKITFLGTGTSQGIPVIGSDHPVSFSKDFRDKRLRSSIMIEYKNFNFVIDCGPDFRQQMLRTNCKKLDAIIFTHEHADHTTGIDDVRPFFFRQGEIPIYLHERVLKSLHERFAYIFDPKQKYPGAPDFEVNLISKENDFQLLDLKVTPVESDHLGIPVLGFRIGNFAYLTDVKTISELELQKLKNLDSLVINALRYESHPSHLNVQEALEIVDTIKPKNTFFTHISHIMGFHEEVCDKLPDSVSLAYDGLVLEIN
ncbi:MAG: MBL fold metallo-hydrolase [Cryomorphaceae bacterium]|nr:MBL fold metallo-hydrolase [Cryomorphaceae bacterium]MBT3503616.1 MBL fold metallo-hydrolase [Cryomorphaceae bacterium]MBT4293102.1 MBL fold metallo-hydrolase [Cryomorphaceae bacterium]MBT4517089.1 MBL fold metallo-hydrolase [Cryomorphaceae bacterium]MBT5936202.1 MBL fold metallo-hydrolase [Cryomorphaceae bacterium]